MRSFGAQPLLFAPGSAHYYSNPGILLAAEAVGRALARTLGERVPGPAVSRYHPFVHERILAPLGMESSGLLPPPEWDGRIAWVERTGTEGMDWEGPTRATTAPSASPGGAVQPAPGAGALRRSVSPPGGRKAARWRWRGRGSAAGQPGDGAGDDGGAVRPPRTPRLSWPRSCAMRGPDATLAAVEWGLGWTVKGSKRPHFSGELTSALTYGHLGATGTMVWADPAQDVACVLLTNRTLVSGWTRERPRQALFSNAVMAALR